MLGSKYHFKTNSGHLLFSSGIVEGYAVSMDAYIPGYGNQIIFIENTNSIDRLLVFLMYRLSTKSHVPLVLLNQHKHHHLYYALYEDPRISHVFHVKDKKILRFLGKKIRIYSSDDTLYLSKI